MSQAQELLSSLSEGGVAVYTATPATEPHIVIGKDRTVTVPPELRMIAVQFDHNIETVVFDCPRYWDEHDLSKMPIYINYIRADGKTGQFPGIDISVDESDETVIHFSWTIKGHVTEAAGAISFLVCAKATDDDGNLANRWSSRLNREMSVDKGLEVSSSTIEEMHPDVITHILLRLDTIEAALENGSGTGSNNHTGLVIPAGILYGDVDGDGEINARDQRAVLRYSGGEITADELNLEAADVNGDGVVDDTDAELISNYAAGLIDGFDAGKYVNWKADGEYFYHDLEVSGVTKNAPVTLLVPGMEIAKTECMDGVIRVFVAEVPSEAVPYSIYRESTSGTVTSIDFTNFANGSFTEVVDGEIVAHSVTFDESGRPATVDGVTLKLPEEVVKYLTDDEVQEMIDTSLGVIENGAY